jgi:predicted TPR repeat methyltransferase
MTEEVELTLEQAMERALTLQREGQLDAAEELYEQIIQHQPEHADAWHFRGLVALQAGRRDEALRFIDQAVALSPGYADALNNRGNVLFMMKRHEEALGAWQQALEVRPDMAEAHFNLGRYHAAGDRVAEALAAFRKVLGLNPKRFEAYHQMAALLYAAGRIDEAAQVYREWIEVEPDNDYARHMLAGCTQEGVPGRASDSTVRRIFNGFAPDFDEQLKRLKYQAPTLVMEGIRRVVGPPAGTLEVLDAGCGTGLCGEGLRPYARRLVGVDLSAGMIKLAEGRGYDELVVAELTGYLGDHPAAYDLIASADTVCYFGELLPLMSAASRALRPGGHLIFTVERGTTSGFQLNVNGRYCHTDAYVKEQLAAAGLTTVMIAAVFLRIEVDKPVAGLLVAARR